MSQQLIDQIRKRRQVRVTLGSITLTFCRPTDLEVAGAGRFTKKDLLTDFVESWEGVLERDILPGESDAAVTFSAELYGEWIADHPEHWDAISGAILDAYKQHRLDRADQTKK